MLAASFAANMAVKQNAADFSLEFPTAGKAVNESFYLELLLTVLFRVLAVEKGC